MRINEYQQEKLASAVVGTPGIDRSGEIIGNAIADLGQSAQKVVLAEKQRRDALDTTVVAEAASKYETALYDTYSAGIGDGQNQMAPASFEKTFQAKSKDILSALGMDKQSPDAQRLFNLKRLDLDTTYHKKVKEWARNQENFNATTALTGNITRTSNAVYDAAKNGRFSDVAQLMKNLDMTAASSTSVLGPAEAAKLLMQGQRDPRAAAFAGVVESDPTEALRMIDDPAWKFSDYFSAEELGQKRDMAQKALVKWKEAIAIKDLTQGLEDNKVLAQAVAQGQTPWELLAKHPHSQTRQFLIDMAVATEQKNITPAEMAYERDKLTEQFKMLKGQTKEQNPIETLKSADAFLTSIVRAGALGFISKDEVTKWSQVAVDVTSTGQRSRNVWGRLAGLNGLQGTEVAMAGWEQIDKWAAVNKTWLPPAASFNVFTRLISAIDPKQNYDDKTLTALVNEQIVGYTQERSAGLRFSAATNGVLLKNSGYTPFRAGSSPEAVPNAPTVISDRVAGTATDANGNKVRVYRDPATGKFFDRAIGGVEVK